ncbi:MAG: phosphate ABC transporter substrate-binding protein [Candidatus Eremiobacteraeota bacterium]|nr:phosphate ABC transporter substrate-binding protein [Candidatus Eremiobacteraeota bacterium]
MLRPNLSLFLAAAFLAACSNNANGSATGSNGAVNVSGSTALLPLVKQAAQRYQAEHSDVKISVSGGGSRVGLTQAMEKAVDIGDSDIPPGKEQTALLDHKVAVVSFAVVTNPSAGVKNLSKKQIADIFTGKITDWKQVGGSGGKITIINRPKSSGTRAVFVSVVLGNQQPTAEGLTQDSSGTVVTTVGQTPGAVSYVSTGYLKNANVTSVGIGGVQPTDANVMSGRYPFWSYEHMVTYGEPNKAAADFIDYVSKDRADLKQLGFLPANTVKPASR